MTSVSIPLTLDPCEFPGMSNRLPRSSQRLRTKAKAARRLLTASRGSNPPLIRSEIPREGRVALRKVRPALDLDVRSETKFHATCSCVGGPPPRTWDLLPRANRFRLDDAQEQAPFALRPPMPPRFQSASRNH